MIKRLALIVALALGAVLLLGVVTNAFADDDPNVPGDAWQQMWQYCHGGAAAGSGGPGIGPGDSTQVAKLLGMTPQELLAERNSGKSIFDIAKAKDVSEQQVLDAALAPFKDMLALRVKYGYLTQEQADQALQQQQDWLRSTFSATGTSPAPGSSSQGSFGGRGMMGGWSGSGMMGGWGGRGTMGGYGPGANGGGPTTGFGGRGMMGGWW